MDLSNQHAVQAALQTGLSEKYGSGRKGFSAFCKDARTYGLGAVLGAALVSGNASAAVDVSSQVSTLVTDGTSAITAVGVGLITLAGIAVVFKWVKAAFFS